MSSPDALLAKAYDHYRRGEMAQAQALGRRLLPLRPNDPAITGLLGMIALHGGDFAGAVPHLRAAFGATPASVPLRINLAFALANSGALDEARTLAAAGDIPALRRIVAFVDQQQGRAQAAIEGYRRVVAEFREDFESWYNLGVLLTAQGALAEAVEAIEQALSLQRDPAFYLALSDVLAVGERHAERRAALRDAVRHFPDTVTLLLDLALAERAMGDFDAAETAYRRALTLVPDHLPAILDYGMMLESLSRIDDMEDLVQAVRDRGVTGGEIDFVEAWLLKRRGRLVEAQALAETVQGVNPSRRAELLGDLADRLGDADRAFDWFSEMNRISAATVASAAARARDFPGRIAATVDLLTPDRIARWSDVALADAPPAPAFLLGFPRSGTTLLDTLLMAMPDIRVLEEMPMVERVESLLGDAGALEALDDETANRLRTEYFRTLDQLQPGQPAAKLIVDKFPLHLVRAPLIHRLFPDAPFLFVERHPCDVVLSCFMARFQTNQAMVQFQDLAATARLYDLALEAWTRASTLLPLRVHRVRYERLVEDVAAEMRPAVAFLGLAWDEAMVDHRASATRRGHVPTASYAQVTEPIYTRARQRWHRYRRQLESVMPVLMPWIERLGYEA